MVYPKKRLTSHRSNVKAFFLSTRSTPLHVDSVLRLSETERQNSERQEQSAGAGAGGQIEQGTSGGFLELVW